MTFPTRHFWEARLLAFNIERNPDEAGLQNELADRKPGMEVRDKNKMEKTKDQREKQIEQSIDKRIVDRQRKADAELARQNSRINDTNATQKKLEAQANSGSTKDDYAARKRGNERADTAALFMEGMTGAPLLRPFEKTQTTRNITNDSSTEQQEKKNAAAIEQPQTKEAAMKAAEPVQKSSDQPTAKLAVEADQAQQKKQDVVEATGVMEQTEKQQNA